MVFVQTTLVELKQQVLFNMQLLQEIATRQKSRGDVKLSSVPYTLPLVTFEDVSEIEHKLKSKEFYSKMV